jgi:ABC-type bacteriocin/lantibiotic exporter with double-glycine peptidase domain
MDYLGPKIIFRKGRLFPRLRFLFFAISCAVLLSSCSALNQVFEQFKPSQDIHQFSDKAVLLDLPFESQKNPYLCGLASAEMLTRYYGVPLNDAQRQSLSEETSIDHGISGAVLKTGLEKAGYFVAVFAGTIDHEMTGIYYQLDRHRPLIIMMGTGDGKIGHYVLLIGYDPERNLIALLDPARGRLSISVEKFKEKWASANQFALLAMPKEILNQGESVNKL